MSDISVATEEPTAPPAEPGSLLSGLQDQAENREEVDEDLESIPHRLEDDQGETVEEGETLERPKFLPEKFWSDNDGVDLEKMSKSYEELEKKFHAGEHKIPDDGYDLTKFENVAADDPMLEIASKWGEQYQVPPAAFDDLISRIADAGYESSKEAEFNHQAELKALGPNAEQIIQQEMQLLDGLQRQGVLSELDLKEAETMFGTAASLNVWRKIRSAHGIGAPSIPSAAASSPDGVSRDEWAAMIADERYGKDRAFTAKVERLATQLFPGDQGMSSTVYFDPAANE